jgi:hypothetical protein
MKRRSFIKKAGIATAGAFLAPYILPSGRLFAATGTRKVNHVVLCMLAGGIRNAESVHQQQSNLMETMLNNVSGGFVQQAGIDAVLPNNPISTGTRLQDHGTLYKEFRFAQGPTGHYNGHITTLTGKYTNQSLNLKSNPDYPTIFEYYRKHNDSVSPMSALNAWWISDSLGPYPALNYSKYGGYGAAYAANYMQPSSLISSEGYNAIGTPKTFTSGQLDIANTIRGFCDDNFSNQYAGEQVGVVNTASEKEQLTQFINDMYADAVAGTPELNAWGLGALANNDIQNVYYTEQVIKRFQPELTVCNMQAVDICHTNFTAYCNNLRVADWGVSHLWDTIQSTPGMANDTVLIVVPEHGRNLDPNTVVDAYGRPAYDHTSDDSSREIFCMIAGPNNVVKTQTFSDVQGESVDIVPTIADLLGFYDQIPGGILDGTPLYDSFY